MKHLKTISWMLYAAICLSALSGCSGKKEPQETAAFVESPSKEETNAASEETTDNEKQSVPEETTLTVWVPDNIRITDWKDNAMTFWLEEQGNFQLEITPLAADDYTTKVNMALTTGSVDELPDIIMMSNKAFPDSMV